MKIFTNWFKRNKKVKLNLSVSSPKKEFPKFLTERKIEKIYHSAFPGNKFGLYSDFFMINWKNNLTFFLDKTENRSYSLFFKNYFDKVKEEFQEKGRNLIIIPEKIDQNIEIPYQYFLPFINKDFAGFENIKKDDFNRYEQILVKYLDELMGEEARIKSIFDGDKMYIRNPKARTGQYNKNFKDSPFQNIISTKKEKTFESFDEMILDFIGYKGDAKSGFLSFYRGEIYFVEKLDDESIEYFVSEYIKHIPTDEEWDRERGRSMIFYSVDKDTDPKNKVPTIEIDEETEKMVDEISEKMEKIIASGQFFLVAPLIEKILKNGLNTLVKPSPIKITSDFKIILTHYDNIEIEMSHLTKAVYLLFLQNSERISLQKLHQYRNELLDLYKKISYKNSIEEMEKSVDAVVDIETKQIYMHLSRIKSAFYKKISFSMASEYCVLGSKNKPKFIPIERNLIIWEED